MTNKLKYFIGNWKMFGDLNSFKIVNNINRFSSNYKKLTRNIKIILCPPNTLIYPFNKKLKYKSISLGAQNCHQDEKFGPHTGSINWEMIKNTGAQYVIIGHSENRAEGDNNNLINKKIKSSIKSNLKIIFCIGETLLQRKRKITHQILKKQISVALKNIKNANNILFSYEPVWSIGTGIIPKVIDLQKDINFINNFLKNNYNIRSPKILYGGSVNNKNIKILKEIKDIKGFLVGGASLDSKKFIDIVKKTFI